MRVSKRKILVCAVTRGPWHGLQFLLTILSRTASFGPYRQGTFGRTAPIFGLGSSRSCTITSSMRFAGRRDTARPCCPMGTNPCWSAPPAQHHRLELRDLHRALGQLSEEHRAAVLLIGLEGMSY